ncbi:MAG: GNAT family N-acetyltransferase [Solirubrobacteraceae bacterium]|nr:GNAT family N-acetyltransferase [Solirubrobacteraceae bacterium]
MQEAAGQPPPAAGVELRSVDRRADAEFLRSVYASTRAEELAVVPWTDAELEAFLRMQFDAQDRHYREQRPAAALDVILVDGAPAGRLYVDRSADEIRIVDIALLPEHRGRGVGTLLIRRVLDEGSETGRPVTIHVERGNRARALYGRLGFRQISTTGVYDLLACSPGQG